jgi:mannosyltransferase OCH1-like enzyme
MEKIIHQIWVGDFLIPNRENDLWKQTKELHPDYEYMLWRDAPELPKNIQYWYDIFYHNKNYAFCADLLRIWVVYKFGGFYLDIDFKLKTKLNDFFKYDSVFFYHNDTDFTIPNNIFASKKEAPIMKHLVNSVREDCSWYGPSWMGTEIKNYLGLPYETPQSNVNDALNKRGIYYHQYWDFEQNWGRHLSLYSWEPKTWERLNKNEQL